MAVEVFARVGPCTGATDSRRSGRVVEYKLASAITLDEEKVLAGQEKGPPDEVPSTLAANVAAEAASEEVTGASPAKVATEPRSPNIGRVVKEFVRHIDSLAETLPLSMLVIGEVRKLSTKKLGDFEKQHCQVDASSGKRRLVDVDQYLHLKRLLSRLDRTVLADHLVPRSFLISLVSQYDTFLGSLIRTLYLLHPEKLNESKKTLTYTDLIDFDSIDAARDYVIEKEVEAVLRESHAEQFEWLENRFQLELRKGLEVWPDFIELTQRRNLFVHAGGIVSTQYLSACRRHGVKGLDLIKRGAELHVTREYFAGAHAAIFEIGVKLAHVMWRKEQPGQRDAADANLIEVTYDLLVEESWRIAQRLLDFATLTLKKWSSDERRRTLVINRCQAYKWDGNPAAAEKILGAEDWTAAADKFKLAEAILRADFARAATLMERIGSKSSDIRKGDYREWPLFREFRKTPEFLAAYERVFGEAFPLLDVKSLPSDLEDKPEREGE